MYIPDLEPIAEMPGSLAVGWLSRNCAYSVVESPDASLRDFCIKIEILSQIPVRLTRGFHTCDICNANPLRGNGEVHVRNIDGKCFVAPALIAHYISKHQYRPPQVFIDSVVTCPPRPCALSDLSQFVCNLRGDINVWNMTTFARLLRGSRVGMRCGPAICPDRLLKSFESYEEVEEWLIPKSPGKMISVLVDIDAMIAHECCSRFAVFDVVDVLRFAMIHRYTICFDVDLLNFRGMTTCHPECVSMLVGRVQ